MAILHFVKDNLDTEHPSAAYTKKMLSKLPGCPQPHTHVINFTYNVIPCQKQNMKKHNVT